MSKSWKLQQTSTVLKTPWDAHDLNVFLLRFLIIKFNNSFKDRNCLSVQQTFHQSQAIKPSVKLVLPGDSVVKNLPANAGDTGSIPALGRCPGGGNSNPLQYSCLENPKDKGAWWATVHGVEKSQTQLTTHTHTSHRQRSLTCFRPLFAALGSCVHMRSSQEASLFSQCPTQYSFQNWTSGPKRDSRSQIAKPMLLNLAALA